MTVWLSDAAVGRASVWVNKMHYHAWMTTLERGRNWKISIYGREHGMPHIHVTGPDFRATLAIANGELLTGSAPADVLEKARAWLNAHRVRALALWHSHNPAL